MIPLELVILNVDRRSYELWRQQFSTYEAVEILNTKHEFSQKLCTLDAILMSGQSAHERFGGFPRYGTSQILSTCHEKRIVIPPWAITIPSLRMDSSLVGEEQMVEELFYQTFKIIFSAIRNFNCSNQHTRITSLGIDLGYVAVGKNQSLEKSKGVKRAYAAYKIIWKSE